jgi:hypothetical protein
MKVVLSLNGVANLGTKSKHLVGCPFVCSVSWLEIQENRASCSWRTARLISLFHVVHDFCIYT